ncbi:MAG: hypothetical protein AAF669_09320 [Pseudomonadota bacterium]
MMHLMLFFIQLKLRVFILYPVFYEIFQTIAFKMNYMPIKDDADQLLSGTSQYTGFAASDPAGG